MQAGGSSARLKMAVGACAAALSSVLGLLSAFAGLPWWLSTAAILAIAAFGLRAYALRRIPTRPVEILVLLALGGLLVLAVREAGDLLSTGEREYRYFATELVLYSRIVPWSKAIVVDSFESGEEIQVVCRTEGAKNPDAVWLRLVDGSYVPDASVYQDYESETLPRHC